MRAPNRRQFLQGGLALAGMGLLAGCRMMPSTAAPHANMARVGFLNVVAASAITDRTEALRQGLHDLRYVEGVTLALEARFADGREDQLPVLAAELVDLKVDVIVTGGPQATRAAKEATATLPIVMAADDDPVGAGFIASLARPDGNITGLSTIGHETTRKTLELSKEILPGLTRLAILGTSTRPGTALDLSNLEAAAASLKVQLQELNVTDAADIEGAFRDLTAARAEAIFLLGSPVINAQREIIINHATEIGLPVVGAATYRGLVGYGANFDDTHRRAAAYVDKILRGARPTDLPVERPTKFDLVVNLKIAHTLGLTIPPSVLTQATELIQ